jgi:hypothetical protein
MLKKLAIAFGIVFLLVGVLGFVPTATPNGHLLGIFHVNAAHNVVHLLTGIVALVCGMTSGQAAQIFFRVFGVLYGFVAALGFFSGDQPILGLISNNLADAWLHASIAAVSLAIGFGLREAASELEPHRPQPV